MLKKYLFLCLIFMATLGATPKDILVVAVQNQTERINPIFSDSHDESLNLIFSGLTRFDENVNIQPDLAKSWNISKDGLTYSFELRNDVLWHDGVKFSAKDVEFTLKAVNDPKLNSPIKSNFEMIKAIKVLDDTHITITLTKPFPPFLDALSVGILPVHLLQNEDLNTTQFNQNPIGTGAFKFKTWKKGEYLSLEANPNYHLGKVQSPKLYLKHITDPNISAIELKNGSVDVALVGFEVLESFQNNPKFKILIEKSADYRALMYNFDNPIFKDKAVREALNYTVDREIIVQKLLHSLGSPAYHPLQNSWANPEKYAKSTYDPKKAEQILLNAGWKKNVQGIFEKNGTELKFDMYALSHDPLRVALIKLLASEFTKIGVKTQIFAKPSGSFDYTKVDTFLVGFGSAYDPDWYTYRVFVSSQDKVWNFGHYNNPKVDEALKKARNTLDKNERKTYYADFITALQEDTPYLFLTYLDFPLVYNKNVKGIKPRVLEHSGAGFSWNAWEWSK